ncbi:MAG: hypothetical protein AB1765_07565 [Candidatus Hydrogenedentota bacterium]
MLLLISTSKLYPISPGKVISLNEKGTRFTSLYVDITKTELQNKYKLSMNPTLIDWGIGITDNVFVRLGAGLSEINVDNGFNGSIGFFYLLGLRWNFLSLDNNIQLSLSADATKGGTKGFGLINGVVVDDSEWVQWQTSLIAHRTFYDKLTFYGGGKYSQADLRLEGLQETDPKHNFGGFLGVELAITKTWVLNGELRIGDENVFSFGLATKY